MNISCDSEVRVLNEHALRFSVVTKPAPVIEYIKTISSLVGASHVLAVFEENDSVKVFFDDKRFVDSLLKSGIHVLGHHVRADYVIPPGTKIVLSNVDPVISNFDVMRLLGIYGTVVSPVVRPPICDDVELCHIGYGVRYVYMVLNSPLPNRLEFKYGDQLCQIKIRMDGNQSLFPVIKPDFDADTNMDSGTQDSSPGSSTPDPYIILQNSDVPVVVSVQSAASETNSEEQPECSNKRDTIPVRRRGRYAKALHLKRKKITATSQAAKRITRNVKHKWGTKKRIARFKKGKPGRKPALRPPVLKPLSFPNFSVADISTPPLLSDESVLKSPEKAVLDTKDLKLFIEEAKHQRAPLELAKKYIGDDCNATVVNHLIDQLVLYNSSHGCHSLRLRVCRLIKCLREAL